MLETHLEAIMAACTSQLGRFTTSILSIADHISKDNIGQLCNRLRLALVDAMLQFMTDS